MSQEQWHVLARGVRRWLWAGALVAVFASARYVHDVRQSAFVATQTLLVSALPPSGGGASASAAADQAADQVAVVYGREAALSSTQSLAAVAQRVRADAVLATQRFGTSGAHAAEAVDVHAPGALTMSQEGTRIAITAHAQSAAGAWLLATAAGQTLAAEAARSLAASAAASQGTTVRVLLAGAASSPVADPAPVASARLRLMETLLLGLAAGLLLVFGLSAREARVLRVAGGSSPVDSRPSTEAGGGA